MMPAAAVLTCRASGEWCRERFRGSLTRTDRAGDAGDVGFAFHAEAQRLAAAEAVLQSVHSVLRLRRLAPSICSAKVLSKETEAEQQTVKICRRCATFQHCLNHCSCNLNRPSSEASGSRPLRRFSSLYSAKLGPPMTKMACVR